MRDGLRIIQGPGSFRFGMDAVLLSAFAKAQPGERVLDLGTGTGIIPILMSARTQASNLTGLEIRPESASMARRSVLLNGLEERITIVEGDLREAARIFAAASFDVVTSNPPYLPVNDGRISAAPDRGITRHEVCASFADVAAAAAGCVKVGGHFYLVHRPHRLAGIVTGLRGAGLEPKRMRFVHPFADRGPNLVLIDSVRGGREHLTVEAPLIVYTAPGQYTDEVLEIYGMQPSAPGPHRDADADGDLQEI